MKKWIFSAIVLFCFSLFPSFHNNISIFIERGKKLDEDTPFVQDNLYQVTQSKGGDYNPENYLPSISYPVPLPNGGNDIFVSDSDFLYSYYFNLKANMPRNHLGICGYTGIAMFLSFFDTYWSDFFIDEKYESLPSFVSSENITSTSPAQSPGVNNTLGINSPYMSTLKNQLLGQGLVEGTISFQEALDGLLMDQIVAQIEEDTFLGKLFSIALENGSIDPFFDIAEYFSNENGYLDGVGVNYSIVSNVLEDYIEQQTAVSEGASIITSTIANQSGAEQERIRNEIIELIQSGKPVLMGGGGYNDSNNNGIFDSTTETSYGHVLVAYDYNETTDTLYGNWGWSGSNTHGNIDQFFNLRIADYWSLDIGESLPHSHSNNYKFSSQDLFLCPCGETMEESVFYPNSYGFEAQYFFYEKTLAVTVENYTITTKRLRTGYIENSFVNLSPTRENAGLAYLEFFSPTYINRFFFEASFWSANEWVDIANFSAKIQYKTSLGVWVTLIDLVKDVNMSTDRFNQDHFDFLIPAENISNIRIYYTDQIPIGDRNKGRISIGNFGILHE